jgi:hypothetical protein
VSAAVRHPNPLPTGQAMGRDLSFERAVRFAAELVRTPSLPGEEGAVAGRILEELRALGFDEALSMFGRSSSS